MARPPHTRTPLVGPLVGWELVRLARRGSAFTSRLVPPLTLLLVLTLFVWGWFYPAPLSDLLLGSARVLTTEQSARFGESFALVVLMALLGVALLVTPAYTCGGISDEKERRTLVFLLASDLSEREIVLGKFLARLILLLGVLAGGLPALAFCLFLGGVDPGYLLAGFGVILVTTAMMAAVSVAAACYAPDLRGALYRGYGLTAVIGSGPACFLLILYAFREHPTSFVAVFLFGLLAAAVTTAQALRLAVGTIRRHRARPNRRPPPVRSLDAEPAAPPRPQYRPPPPIPPRPPIPDGEGAFDWKERHVRGVILSEVERVHAKTVIYGGLAGAAYAFSMVGLPMLMMAASDTGGAFGQLLVVLGSAAAGMLLFVVGSLVAGAVSRERQRRTLESLLAIPVDRAVILRAKANVVLGSWWLRGCISAAVVVWFGAMFGAEAAPGLGLVFATAAAAVPAAGMWLVFAAGLWMSVHATSPWRVVMRLLPLIGFVAVAPPVVVAAHTAERAAWLALGLLGGAGLMGLAGWACWRRAFRDFDRCKP